MNRTQDTEDCRGLWEWRMESEGQVSLLSRSLPPPTLPTPDQLSLARTQAGTKGGEENVQDPEVGASKARTPDPWTSGDHFRYSSVCKARAVGPVHSEAWATGLYVRKKFGSWGRQPA